MPQPVLIAGNHVKCYINGVLLGLVVSTQWTIGSEYRECREIDSNIPKELAPGQYSIRGTFGILRARSSGGLEGAGLVATAENMLRQKLIVIELVDLITEETIFRAEGCQIVGQSWGLSPKQLVSGQFQFTGTTFNNEART